MYIRILFRSILLTTVLSIPAVCLAQEARIVIPAGLVNEAYSQNIAEVLRDKYRVSLKSSSPTPSFEWRIVGPAPSGLSIDRGTGTLFGTPVSARTHLFRVEVLDRALSKPSPLRLLVSLQIASGEAPVLVPVEVKQPSIPSSPPSENSSSVEESETDEDVEIPAVLPRKNFTLPIKIKKDSIRQLEVVARNRASQKSVSALTPADLPRGEVLTSVNLQLEEGENSIYILDAETKKVYRALEVTIRPTDVDKSAEVDLELKHSGFVSEKEEKASVTVNVGPKVRKIGIATFEKDVSGNFTKELEKIEAPALKRDTDSYPITVPLSKSEVTQVKVTADLTSGSKVEKFIQIKREKALNAKGSAESDKTSPIKIENTDEKVSDVSAIDTYLTIAKNSKIKRIRYDVSKDGEVVYTGPETTVNPTAEKEDKKRVRVKILAGENMIRFYDVDKFENQALTKITCEGRCPNSVDFETTPTAFTRAIVGLEQIGASSANSEQKLFLEFNLTAPLFSRRNASPIKAPFWVWLNPRITGVAQTTGTVAEFATSANFFSPFVGGKVNDIVQGFGFIGGIEVPFRRRGSTVTATTPSGFGSRTKARFSLSFIAGAGALTPLSSQKSLQVFTVNTSVTDRFPDAAGKQFIAFVSPDRTRFLRQYFGGLRLKTYFVKDDGTDDPLELEPIFPGVIDITFGQNEAVTRGRFRGGVVRIDGIYPLPFLGNDNKGLIYAFGSVQMKLTSTKIEPPIFLELAQPIPTVPATNVFVTAVPPIDRDVYKIGVGVDLIRLLRRNQ